MDVVHDLPSMSFAQRIHVVFVGASSWLASFTTTKWQPDVPRGNAILKVFNIDFHRSIALLLSSMSEEKLVLGYRSGLYVPANNILVVRRRKNTPRVMFLQETYDTIENKTIQSTKDSVADISCSPSNLIYFSHQLCIFSDFAHAKVYTLF